MAAYADFEYYSGTFGGSAIPEAEFGRYALRASREVDKITLYRIQNPPGADSYPVDNKVKDAVCAVAEVLFRHDQEDAKTGGALVESETVDSHTVRFKVMGADKLAEFRATEIWAAARGYLTSTGLLYRGIGRTCGL